MSIYRPDLKTLYPAQLSDGWWVMDQFGPLDGPYGTVGDANAAIAAENELPGDYGYENRRGP